MIDESQIWMLRYAAWLIDFTIYCVFIYCMRRTFGRKIRLADFAVEMQFMFCIMSVLKLIFQRILEG